MKGSSLDDFMLSINVMDYTKDGECSRCGECCGDVLPVTEAEITVIKRYAKKYGIKDQQLSILAPGIIDLTCPFISATDKRCLIYEVRPHICRAFVCNLTPEAMMENKKLHIFDPKRKARSLRAAIYGAE